MLKDILLQANGWQPTGGWQGRPRLVGRDLWDGEVDETLPAYQGKWYLNPGRDVATIRAASAKLCDDLNAALEAQSLHNRDAVRAQFILDCVARPMGDFWVKKAVIVKIRNLEDRIEVFVADTDRFWPRENSGHWPAVWDMYPMERFVRWDSEPVSAGRYWTDSGRDGPCPGGHWPVFYRPFLGCVCCTNGMIFPAFGRGFWSCWPPKVAIALRVDGGSEEVLVANLSRYMTSGESKVYPSPRDILDGQDGFTFNPPDHLARTKAALDLENRLRGNRIKPLTGIASMVMDSISHDWPLEEQLAAEEVAGFAIEQISGPMNWHISTGTESSSDNESPDGNEITVSEDEGEYSNSTVDNEKQENERPNAQQILDNTEESKTVAEWIKQWTTEGSVDAVTGYFTIGALAFINEELNDRLEHFRMVVGDIVRDDTLIERPLDLLNEDISLNASLELKTTAQKAIDFLEQESVDIRAMSPRLCHAKMWLCKAGDARQSYYVTGSSNLTEAGLGLKTAPNLELNLAGQGTHTDYSGLKSWFADLWKHSQVRRKRKVGNTLVDVKQYLIDQIRRILIEYSPKQLYYKTLFELFGNEVLGFEDDPEMARQLGKLQHSAVYESLYEFQKKGALSLIKMIETYGGAILADAVGLGKTWTALAVIKHYQSQGCDTLVLCPKKLRQNWQKFLRRQGSRFERDAFDYVIRYHTDLQDERLEGHADGLRMEYFHRDRPKLLVIDESHNLRNSRSNHYKFLVSEILRKNPGTRVLLLSATPINNALRDVCSQFSLLVCDRDNAFRDSLGVNSLDGCFRRATQEFNKWFKGDDHSLSALLQSLPNGFRELTDKLIVSRTRRLIAGQTDALVFPERDKPQNEFIDSGLIGKFKHFEEFLDAFPPFFSAYRPSHYIEQAANVDVLKDEKQRDMFLVKMMMSLLLKRLESSWYSFQSTIEKVHGQHVAALAKVKQYESNQGSESLQLDLGDLEGVDDFDDLELTLGKREIAISEIDKHGALNRFKANLAKDVAAMERLLESLALFEKQVDNERQKHSKVSRDAKLARLIEIVRAKQKAGANRGNRKVVIFSAYADTVKYLFDQLQARGFTRVAMVYGDGARVAGDTTAHKKFEPILERFAPYTKLYIEREWPAYDPPEGVDDPIERFEHWQEWIQDNTPSVATQLDHPIDILIATDCLSEGQNLQDADMVINYDIHWNPVRAIQRMGRIDRLGSTNEKVFAVNFWPTGDLNSYLDLQKRVEKRMTAMVIGGAEVPEDFTADLQEMLDDDQIQQSQEAQLMKQMQAEMGDIDGAGDRFGFDVLSREGYRQELTVELNKDRDALCGIPDGVYTGFERLTCKHPGGGIAALIRHRTGQADAFRHELVYVDYRGARHLTSMDDILKFLAEHKEQQRVVPAEVDAGDAEAVKALSDALRKGLQQEADTPEQDAAPATAGMEVFGAVGARQPVEPADKKERQDPELVLWFLVD